MPHKPTYTEPVQVFKPFQTLAQPPVYRCRSQPAFAWLDSWLLLGHSPFTWCCVVVLGGIRLLRSKHSATTSSVPRQPVASCCGGHACIEVALIAFHRVLSWNVSPRRYKPTSEPALACLVSSTCSSLFASCVDCRARYPIITPHLFLLLKFLSKACMPTACRQQLSLPPVHTDQAGYYGAAAAPAMMPAS